MTILNSKTVIQILKQYDREGHVDSSPRLGHVRMHYMNNDVIAVIERIGGMEAAAVTLGVSIVELDKWIDEHYVPKPYASLMNKCTGYSIQSIQQPTFYVYDRGNYWPHPPTSEELNHPMGICIYRRYIPPCASSRQPW